MTCFFSSRSSGSLRELEPTPLARPLPVRFVSRGSLFEFGEPVVAAIDQPTHCDVGVAREVLTRYH